MSRASIGAEAILAALGTVVILVSVLALPWYGVGEGKIAPIEIRHPAAPTLHAQLEAPGQSELPEELPPGAAPDVPEQDEFGAWTAQGVLGTLGNLVLLLAALASAALAALQVSRRLAQPRAWLLPAALGLAAILVVVLRIVFRPEEIDGYEFEATLKSGAFVALAGAALVAAGGAVGVTRGRTPGDAARASGTP